MDIGITRGEIDHSRTDPIGRVHPIRRMNVRYPSALALILVRFPRVGAWRYARPASAPLLREEHATAEAAMTSTLIGKQAVVIGAGIAGLTAAAALADRFDQVVVLERDTLPSEPAYRAGTPQARHVHGLLFSGQRALSELFPGFEQDLARAGAVPLRAGLDVRVERPGYDPFPQRDLGWSGYAASRPAIERAVRQRVVGRANATLRQRCRVKEVLASPDGAAVTGVRCENESGASETIAADLVVDASGRGAPTLGLLRSIGRPLPEATIGIDLANHVHICHPDDA